MDFPGRIHPAVGPTQASESGHSHRPTAPDSAMWTGMGCTAPGPSPIVRTAWPSPARPSFSRKAPCSERFSGISSWRSPCRSFSDKQPRTGQTAPLPPTADVKMKLYHQLYHFHYHLHFQFHFHIHFHFQCFAGILLDVCWSFAQALLRFCYLFAWRRQLSSHSALHHEPCVFGEGHHLQVSGPPSQ